MRYARTIELDAPYEETIPRVKDAFKAHGFGTITEIDVRATLKEKLGEEVDPYIILGTCNPGLAHGAIEIEPEVGVLLPCNVVVRARGDRTLVHALDPEVIASVSDRPELEPIAREAGESIRSALDSLAGGQASG